MTNEKARDGLIRLLMLTLGTFILLIGLLVMVLTPIPGGGIIVTLGLTILICSSKWATICIRGLRSRFNSFNKGMTWLEERMGERAGKALVLTRPLDE